LSVESDNDVTSSVGTPKVFRGPNILNISEQQYFVWDTASQSTNDKIFYKFGGGMALLPPWLRLDGAQRNQSLTAAGFLCTRA